MLTLFTLLDLKKYPTYSSLFVSLFVGGRGSVSTVDVILYFNDSMMERENLKPIDLLLEYLQSGDFDYLEIRRTKDEESEFGLSSETIKYQRVHNEETQQ